MDVDLLVWSDKADPAQLVADSFAPPTAGGLVDTRFATKVSAKCTCVTFADAVPEQRFTQLVYLDSDNLAASAVGAQVPIPAGASSVQVRATNLLGIAVPIVAGQVRAAFRAEDTAVPQNVTPPMSALNVSWPEEDIAIIPTADGGAQSERVPVPRTLSNILRISNNPIVTTKVNATVAFDIDC